MFVRMRDRPDLGCVNRVQLGRTAAAYRPVSRRAGIALDFGPRVLIGFKTYSAVIRKIKGE